MTPSPARAGFATVLRRPRIFFAELAWRWTFGTAAIALLLFTWLEFLRGIEISEAEYALRNSPLGAADALARVLGANTGPLLRATAVLLPGLALLWIVAGSLGRGVTLRALYPAGAQAGNDPRIRTLFGLNVLRAALGLAAIGGYLAAAFLASLVAGSGEEMSLGVFFLIFIPLFGLVIGLWGMLNWYLSLAALFAARAACDERRDERSDTFAAVARAVALSRRRASAFASVGTIYGVLRLLALIVATMVSLAVIAAEVLPKWFVIVALVVITLAYCAAADFLYVGRLAAYAAIAEDEPEIAGGATAEALSVGG